MTIIVTETSAGVIEIPPGGPLTASDIITSAAFTLQDSGHVAWGRAELLSYVSDAQRDACVVKPDVYTLTQTLPLVAGTRQQLPDNGAAFVRFARNMGADGMTPGRAPRRFTVESLDQQNPNWHIDTPSPTVLEYGYDEREPKVFYVSPPQPDTNRGHGDVVFHAVPEALTSEADLIVLDAIYKTALQHYVCYRAYLKQGELANNADALAHRAEFLSLLGAKEAGEQKARA